MEDIFTDISKYYAATIYDNSLTIGRIQYLEDRYDYVRDRAHGPFNLADPDADVTRMVTVIAEIHPLQSIEKIVHLDVKSCLYLNENFDSGEIEVRSIHKGLGTSIYRNQECPLILWNPNYDKNMYFDVIDIQNVFPEERLKHNFSAILSESLREFELFPPLLHLKR